LGLANLAVDEATQSTPLVNDRRRALMVGTTKGTLPAVLQRQQDDPFADLAASLARWLGAAGPVRTVGAACASSTAALGEAFDLLREDHVDDVFVIGVEALHRCVVAGLH
jgi:3-oxoacyl-(acyl-carrier-protein) synthase